MPYGAQHCLALLVPSMMLIWAALWLDVKQGHERNMLLIADQKSRGGMNT